MKYILQLTILLVLFSMNSFAQDNKKQERLENRIEKLMNKLTEDKTDTLNVLINIVQVQSNKGVIRIAIYDNADSAFDEEKAVASIILPAKDNVSHNFKLKQGKYAIVAFHDENNNGFLDTNFLGIPKEKYGFSGGANSPNYKKAEISIRKSQDIVIKIK